MNCLAKGKKHALKYYAAVGMVVLLSSCKPDSPEQVKERSLSDATEQAQADTATPAGPDSTLQSVEEITLHTVGDEENRRHFDMDTIEVKAGSLVKLTLVNQGTEQSMIHNIVFTRKGKATQVALAGEKVGAPGNYVPDDTVRVLASSPLALPGQTVSIEFEAPTEPGFFDFVCTYPEHYKHMRGVMLVK